jgi:hypothetical protein
MSDVRDLVPVMAITLRTRDDAAADILVFDHDEHAKWQARMSVERWPGASKVDFSIGPDLPR